jgi:hypothetical protein
LGVKRIVGKRREREVLPNTTLASVADCRLFAVSGIPLLVEEVENSVSSIQPDLFLEEQPYSGPLGSVSL